MPILGLSAYAYFDLRRTVDQQIETELENTVRSLGQATLNRLDLAERRLQSLTVGQTSGDIFSEVRWAAPQSSRSETILATVLDPGQDEVTIELTAHRPIGSLVGRVHPDYLQAVMGMRPAPLELCILNANASLVTCSSDIARQLMKEILGADKGGRLVGTAFGSHLPGACRY